MPRATPRGTPRGAWIAVAALVALGLWLRLHDLGRLGLIADEGHQALAVRGVLAQGVPIVPAGNIYLRGAPFIYAEALTAAAGGVNEFTLRVPAAIFSAGVILLVFFFARTLFDLRTGLLAAFLSAFSIWEISLARYARMYTLLELSFLTTAFFFYRGYMAGGSSRDRAFAWAAGAVAAVTHQLGIFVLLFYALPIFVAPPAGGERRRFGWGRLLWPALGLACVWFAFHELEGRLLDRATPPFREAAGAVEPGSEDDSAATDLLKKYLLVPPVTLALELAGRDRTAVLLAVLVAAAALVAAVAGGFRPRRRLRTLWALAIVAVAFANLIALALALLAAYLVLLPASRRDLGRAPLRPALLGAALLGIYWGAVAVRHPSLLATPWGTRSLGEVLFGYPPVVERALTWFIAGWPLASLVVGATVLVLLIRFASDRRRARDLFAAMILLLPLLAAAATREIHNESRYHFHLYPFILTLLAAALATATRLVAGALDTGLAIAGRSFRGRVLVEVGLAVLLAFLVTPDIAPHGIQATVAGDYATPRDPIRAPLNWLPYATFHQDHAGPAAAIRAARGPSDLVLVAGPPYWASIYWHYLGRIDYVISEKAQRAGRNGVTLHHVTGARSITSADELDRELAAAGPRRVWLLSDTHLLGAESRYFSAAMKERLAALTTPPHALGRDGVTVAGGTQIGGDATGSRMSTGGAAGRANIGDGPTLESP